MYTKVEDLREGNVLLEDVMGAAADPLVKKHTVLNGQHIHFLKAFLIKGVEVGKQAMNQEAEAETKTQEKGQKKEKNKPIINEVLPTITRNHFYELFSRAVGSYKAEFQKWQSGAGVNIIKAREIILPLIEYSLKNPKAVTDLQKYSTKKDYLYEHPIAIGLLSAAVANRLKMDKGSIIQAGLAGMLADCGMAKVNPAILIKSTPLNNKEYSEIKDHPRTSYNMVKDLSLLKPEAKLAIFQHHERMDGSGYLMGERAEKLHLFSQIVAVVDTFHAMTSERMYRTRQAPFKVLEMIKEDFFGKFGITPVKILMSLFANTTPGEKVRLSNQLEGTILFVKQEHPTRPLIKLADETIIDLETRRDLFIEELL